MPDSERRPGPFKSLKRTISLIRTVIRSLLVLGAGWLAYSRFMIPRKLSPTHALGGERRTMSSGDLTISYYVSGEGKPLVLLHNVGMAASAYEVKPLYDHFAASRQVYAPDLPGCGFSSHTDVAYSPRLYADVLVAFIRTAIAPDGGPVDLVASGLSGEFAARATVEAPELFSSLTLIMPPGLGYRRARPPRANDALLAFLKTPLWSQAIYDLLTTRRALRLSLSRAFADRRADENMVAYAYLMARQPGARHAAFAYLSGQLSDAGITRIYDRLNIPVLVIAGRGMLARFDLLSSYAERPNWSVFRLDNARRIPHFEQAKAVNEILSAFLSDYTLPERT